MKVCIVLFAAMLLAAGGRAYGQPSQLHIDDGGKVMPQHEHHHTKAGRKVTWVRDSGSGKPWLVRFTGDSPCQEGKEFGSGRATTCTISVCKAKGDPGCKAYAYTSSTGPNAAQNDPDIIVDP